MPEEMFGLKPKHIYLLHILSFVAEDDRAGYIQSKINDYSDSNDRMLSEDELTDIGRPLAYAPEFVEKFTQFYRDLLKEPGTAINVVEGLDDVCSLGCNRHTNSCEGSDEYWKELIYKSFGIGVGDTFSLSKIAKT